jgi:four helix bundle protein
MIAKKFEDLIFWQKSRELTKLIYSFTRNGDFKKDFGLKEQIQRASVSVMSNIAERFGRGGNKELIQFLFVAKGSLAEIQAQLYVPATWDTLSLTHTVPNQYLPRG